MSYVLITPSRESILLSLRLIALHCQLTRGEYQQVALQLTTKQSLELMQILFSPRQLNHSKGALCHTAVFLTDEYLLWNNL